MAIDYNALAIPKGPSKRKVKARKDREDADRLRAFRNLVWSREESFLNGDVYPVEMGLCQHCKAVVSRFKGQPMTGEVHHRIYRGNKATRYDPDNGVLLCNHLVNNCHEKAERKLIEV